MDPAEPSLRREIRSFVRREGRMTDSQKRALEEIENGVFADRHPIDENTLAEVDQVGRGVAPDAHPSRSKNRLRGGDDTSLPVGPADVQHREMPMRVAEMLEKRVHALQAELPDAGRAREERIDRGAIGRQGDVHPAAAGCKLMCRKSCPMVRFRSRRCTTASSMPFSDPPLA